MAQRVIKIGSSAGVTIPKKQLDELGIHIGDEVSIKISLPKKDNSDNTEVLRRARDILRRYRSDFENLAKR